MDVLWQCNSNLRDRHRTCGTNTFRRRFYPMQLTARTVSLEEQPVLILCQTWLPGQCVSKFDGVCTLLASLLEAPLQCSSVKGELNPSQEVLWVLSKLHRKRSCIQGDGELHADCGQEYLVLKFCYVHIRKLSNLRHMTWLGCSFFNHIFFPES